MVLKRNTNGKGIKYISEVPDGGVGGSIRKPVAVVVVVAEKHTV